MINICMITDKNYINPTRTCIKSIEINSQQDTKYNIYVFVHNVEKDDIEKLKQLNSANISIKIINKIPDNFCENVNIERHVTTAALLKFYIPQILSDENKILYLDSDILIQQDLSELYNTDISGYYAAVVKDTMTISGINTHLKRLKYPHQIYFNSGMMLLNLDLMRKDSITEKLIDYRLNGINFFMDQDALNVVLGKNIKCLPLKYNMLNYYFEKFDKKILSDLYLEDFDDNNVENYKKAVVLHLGGKEKPWMYNISYLSDLYIKYARLVQWDIAQSDLKKLPEKVVKSKIKLFNFITVCSIKKSDRKTTYKVLGIPFSISKKTK